MSNNRYRYQWTSADGARQVRRCKGELTGQPPPVPPALRAADRAYRNAIDNLARQAGLAA
jgi:hypothetical protein